MKPVYYFSMLGFVSGLPLGYELDLHEGMTKGQDFFQLSNFYLMPLILFVAGLIMGWLCEKAFPIKLARIRPLIYCATLGLIASFIVLPILTLIIAKLNCCSMVITASINYLEWTVSGFAVLGIVVGILIGVRIERESRKLGRGRLIG